MSALIVGIALGQMGCVLDQLRTFRGPGQSQPTVPPTKDQLVSYLNENSKRIDSLRSNNISISCYYKLLPPMQLDAKLVCEKPRNLRLAALSGVGTEVDLGSNSQEFWWWIKRAQPPAQFYCSYADLEAGRVRVVPFPFQPEWIMEAMGIGNYGTADQYDGIRAERDGTVKLYRRTRSPQGRPITKVIVFKSSPADVNHGAAQVLQHQLLDENNKLIVWADISKVQVDSVKGGVLPQVMTLNWPAERLKMTMTFDKLEVNTPIQSRDAFARTYISNVQAIDLARIPASNGGVQRVQGTQTMR
jgi:hypothetical protein